MNRNDESAGPLQCIVSLHTPGPWKNEYGHIRGRGIVIARVAECDRTIEGKLVLIESPEYAANSRLIAAAPELLAALEYAVVPLTASLGDNHPKVLEARAAIAKATGMQANAALNGAGRND